MSEVPTALDQPTLTQELVNLLNSEIPEIETLLDSPSVEFKVLSETAGLDLKSSFRNQKGLRDTPLAGADITGINFSGSDMRGTFIRLAIYDKSCCFDNCLLDREDREALMAAGLVSPWPTVNVEGVDPRQLRVGILGELRAAFSKVDPVVYKRTSVVRTLDLAVRSLSLNLAEKLRVLCVVPTLTDEKLQQLSEVFIEEAEKFRTLAKTHQEDILNLIAKAADGDKGVARDCGNQVFGKRWPKGFMAKLQANLALRDPDSKWDAFADLARGRATEFAKVRDAKMKMDYEEAINGRDISRLAHGAAYELIVRKAPEKARPLLQALSAESGGESFLADLTGIASRASYTTLSTGLQMLEREVDQAKREDNAARLLTLALSVADCMGQVERARELTAAALASGEITSAEINTALRDTLRSGQPELTRAIFTAALQQNPENHQLRGNLGWFLFSERADFVGARRELRLAHTDAPEDLRIAYQLATSELLLAPEGASQHLANFEALVKASSDKARWGLELAFLLGATGRADGARALIEFARTNASKELRESDEFKQAKSLVYYQLGKLPAAERAIRTITRTWNAKGNHAMILFALGRNAEAKKLIEGWSEATQMDNPLRLECAFYRWAHVEHGALGKVHELIRQGVRSPLWRLTHNVERARKSGHPEADLVAAVAQVLGGFADAATLDKHRAWRALGGDRGDEQGGGARSIGLGD